jgi:hypothetical protein
VTDFKLAPKPVFIYLFVAIILYAFLVSQALDTLGNTKWRINKRVLVVVDRIWASGGHLAGLVDREDVSYLMTRVFFLSLFVYFSFIMKEILSVLLLHCLLSNCPN